MILFLAYAAVWLSLLSGLTALLMRHRSEVMALLNYCCAKNQTGNRLSINALSPQCIHCGYNN